jgi:hypothetical protein
MNSYGNPLITYDEIVEALRAIIDCSKNNGYLDEYSFLNAKYDSVKNNPLQAEQEKALIKAIQSLEKTIEAANKVVRENLEKEIAEISATNIFTIPTKYKQNEESRKLASQDELVAKLQEMSLPLEVLSQPIEEEEKEETIEMFEEITDGFEEIIEEPAVEEEIEIKLEKPKKKIDIMSMELPEISLELTETEELEEEDTLENFKEDKTKIEAEEQLEDDNEDSEEEIEDPKVDTSKIELIKKALEKAKEKENEQLVKILEQQLIKEVEALKS